jgi:hypothetical protein
MGAGQSIPSTLTREKAFELTRDTRGLMNILLEYMLKELTVRDFLALSNPNECKKYVLFLANELHKHFYELQIAPTKDKRGVIAFRPVKEITSSDDSSDLSRQSLCLSLAYFYTRIFQIYGALALTLIDDAQYMSQSGLLPKYGDITRGLLPPGYKPYATMGGTVHMEGGTISASALGAFNFLRYFLIDEIDSTKGYRANFEPNDNSKRALIYFKKIQVERDVRIPTTTISESGIQNGKFSIGIIGAKQYVTLECVAAQKGIGGDIGFSFRKLNYVKKDSSESKSIEITTDIIPIKTITISQQRPKGKDTTIIYTIKNLKLKDLDYKNNGEEADKELSPTIFQFFNYTFNKLIPFIKNIAQTEDYVSRTSGVVGSETGTSEELRMAKIINNLTKTKPLGHCLARALQLLNNIPMKDEPGISHICKPKFFQQTRTTDSGIKESVSRSGIPEPGQPLETSPGMSALAQLFYDTIYIGTPKIFIGQTPGKGGQLSSEQQYVQFMKKMAQLFGDTESQKKSDKDLVQYGLEGIKNRRDKLICDTFKLPENIMVPSSSIKNIYTYINQLYQTQVKHAAECGKIFKMLFNIQRDKASGRYIISLSENVIKKGFPEIDRINYISRQVLISYYTNCETSYILGMNEVVKASRPASSAPTPSATAPVGAPITGQTK